MNKEKQLVLTVCKTLIKHSKDILSTLNSPAKRVAFLIEKLSSLKIEITSEERKQFQIFGIQILLTTPTVDAKLKKNLFIYALRNKISILDMQHYFNELQKTPLSFAEIIAKDFFLPLINQTINNQQSNEMKIFFDEEKNPEEIRAYNQTLLKANKQVLPFWKQFTLFNSLSFKAFVAFSRGEVVIEENRCIIPTSIAHLFQMPTPLLTRLLTNSNLDEGASFEKGFEMIHYDSWKQSWKNESVVDFEYETPVETIPQKPKYEFKFQSEYLVHLHQFFLSFDSALNKILIKFQAQYQEGDFLYQEAMYNKITTMVSRWFKYAFLLFHILEEEDKVLHFENTYKQILFFLEYYKHFSWITPSTHYKHPSIARKIGLIAFYTPFSLEVLGKHLIQAKSSQKVYDTINTWLKNELYFEIFSYEEDKTTFNALINPIKSLDGGSMIVYKFLLKKIKYLLDFKFGSINTPESIAQIKELYLSNNLSFHFVIDNKGQSKSILRCQDKSQPTFVQQSYQANSQTIWGGFFSKLFWKSSSQKDSNTDNTTSTLLETNQNSEHVFLKEVFAYFPLQYCKEEQLPSPYHFLKNYKNPLYSLNQFYTFNTQSYYQLLKIQQAITEIRGVLKILYNISLKNIGVQGKGFEFHSYFDELSGDMKKLLAFNQQLPQVVITLQSLVAQYIPLIGFPEAIKKQGNYTLILTTC